MCEREGEYKIQTKLTNNGREREREKKRTFNFNYVL